MENSEIQQASALGHEPIIREVKKTTLPSSETLFVNGLGYLISFMASRRITNIHKGLESYIQEAEQFYEFHGTSLNQTLSKKIQERAKRFNIPLEELNYD